MTVDDQTVPAGVSETPEPRQPIGQRPGRHSWPPVLGQHPFLTRSAVVGLAAVLVAVTVFVAGERAAAPSTPSPSSPLGSSDVAASSPLPGATERWSALEAPPLAPVATLTASKVQPAGIARDAVFTLRSLAGTPATALAAGLVSDPPVAFAVKRGTDASTATVAPKTSLRPGGSYRITLRAPDGSLGGSWLFRVEGPPTVVSTIPAAQATDVPVASGIEVTFDQHGVGSIERFFSISPSVSGRFERHDRTWVFVPATDLAHSTIYTFTVRKGVPLAGSRLTLESDVVVSFETAPAPPPSGPTQLGASFVDDLLESSTADRPIVPMNVERAWDSKQVEATAADIVVHRLAGSGAALDAVRTLRAGPSWAQQSDAGLVRTLGLPVVFHATLPIRASDQGGERESYIELPMPLDAGWYLISRIASDRDQQVVLQVTDVSAFLQQTTTRSVLWVNDLSTGRGIVGARLWTSDGRQIGSTDKDGLAIVTLPRVDYFVVTASDGGTPPDGVVPGRSLLMPLYLAPAPTETRPCSYGWEGGSNLEHWTMLETDRHLFQTSDEIDAWGLVKRRDGGTVANAELRLTRYGGVCRTSAEAAADALVRMPLTLGGRTGTFAVRVPLENLPSTWYALELWADGRLLQSRGFTVDEIRKPSYAIAVSTDRHVLVDGDRLTTTAAASFFDGTPAPQIDIRLNGLPGAPVVTTGSDGRATTVQVATFRSGSYRTSEDYGWVQAEPRLAEEGAAPTTSTGWAVLPSTVVMSAEAEVSGGTLRVTGKAGNLDQAASEATYDTDRGGEWPVTSGPAAQIPIHVRVTDQWWDRIATGRSYDFIRKRSYDTYRYEPRQRVMAETDVVASAAGTVALSFPTAFRGDPAPKNHEYTAVVSAVDAQGRRVDALATARHMEFDPYASQSGRQELSFAEHSSDPVALGSRMSRRLEFGGTAAPSGGANSYLFATSARGLTSAQISRNATYVHVMSAADMPNAGILGVWFTGVTYVTTWDWVRFDADSRALAVSVVPDRTRYAPGDAVRLSIRTATTDGTGVPATVVVRGVDERLYSIGAAHEVSSRPMVYQEVETGFAFTWFSHRTPMFRGYGGQGGDTTGGGNGPAPRERFRDMAVFERVTTDATGRASLTFTLPDDITSWRINGAGFTGDLRVGDTTTSLPVGLPMFVEAPVAPSYLASDRPTVMLRAYGSGLTASSRVTFTVSAPSLGMAPTVVTAPAFTRVGVALPALRVGEHAIRIEARASGAGGTRLSDALVRTLRVVESRFTRTATTFVVLPSALPAVPASGYATYVVSDAGRGRYLAALESLAWGGGDRVDEALAALIARDVLEKSFGIDASEYGGYPYSLRRYLAPAPGTDGGWGIALLPYASPDLALSARVALLAADRFEAGSLVDYFSSIRTDPASTRERRLLALAGLAATGPVASGTDGRLSAEVLAALRTPDLSVREALYLALAAAVLGDHGAALTAERAVVARYGQRLGPWVRLNVGDDAAILEATSLLALIAVTAGDPLADAAEAYVAEHRSSEDLYELQQAAFLRAAVERSPVAKARFAYTVGGVRRTVELRPGESRRIELAPSQRTAFSIQPLAGRVGVAVRWEEPAAPASVAVDRTLRLARSISPSSPIPAGSVVTVVLTPTFGQFRMTGCYRVVDLAPSGLEPLSWAYGGTHGSEDVTPWEIVGQKVVFCASPSSARPPRLVYYARVVTPGTYTWEPAVMQASRATESATLTATERVIIR